jgi:hypothetical protein
MTNIRVQPRVRALLAACVAALALGVPSVAQAGGYYHTAWDIGTNYGRTCAHGLNGTANPMTVATAPNVIVDSEATVACNLGGSGQAAEIYASLYLEWNYVTQVSGLGVGESHSNGSCGVLGQWCGVHAQNRHPAIPAKYKLTGWWTYLLPTTGVEEFGTFPRSSEADCNPYWRLHDALNGWHLSGLTCFGTGAFAT